MLARRLGYPVLNVVASVTLTLSVIGTAASRGLPAGSAHGSDGVRACGWEVVSSPLVDAAEHQHETYRAGEYESETLVGVAAVSATNVWTIGRSIEHWNGSGWTVYQPVRTDNLQQLNAIAAVSAIDIWVVGGDSYFGPGKGRALIDHWNGSAWSGELLPERHTFPAGRSDLLYDVAVSPAHDVWSAGGIPVIGDDVAYAGRWNGRRWIGAVPPIGNINPDELYGVAPISSNDVLAVGRGGYAAQWDGKQWTALHIPFPANAIAATSATDAWAVGGGYHRAIEHWNGLRWHRVHLPFPQSWLPELESVSIVGPDDAWAVGQTWHVVRQRVVSRHALVAHWDGTRWTRSVSPTVHAGFSDLASVSTLPNGDAWAVGSYGNAHGEKLRPLMEHYVHC